MKAVFVTYGGGHVNMVIPVARELMRRSWDVSVLGLTTARRVLEQNNIPSLGFIDLVTPDDTLALKAGEELARTYHQDRSGVRLEEAIAYLGLSYTDLERQIGPDQARSRLDRLGRRALLPLGTMKRFLTAQQPDVVVTTNSPRAEEAAIRSAGALGIPAVCMVDLFGIDWEPCVPAENGFADRLAVFSEYTKTLLVERGRNAESIQVTGNPAFDGLNNYQPEDVAKLRSQGGNADRYFILWASQPTPEPDLSRQILAELHRIAAIRSDWQILYRPHPSEAPLQLPEGSQIRLCPAGLPLPVVLHAAHSVIIVSSTVGIEAALAGASLVQIMFSEFSAASPYTEMGIALPLRSPDALEATLECLRNPSSAEHHALSKGRTKLPQPGGATDAVCRLIGELAAKTPS